MEGIPEIGFRLSMLVVVFFLMAILVAIAYLRMKEVDEENPRADTSL